MYIKQVDVSIYRASRHECAYRARRCEMWIYTEQADMSIYRASRHVYVEEIDMSIHRVRRCGCFIKQIM